MWGVLDAKELEATLRRPPQQARPFFRTGQTVSVKADPEAAAAAEEGAGEEGGSPLRLTLSEDQPVEPLRLPAGAEVDDAVPAIVSRRLGAFMRDHGLRLEANETQAPRLQAFASKAMGFEGDDTEAELAGLELLDVLNRTRCLKISALPQDLRESDVLSPQKLYLAPEVLVARALLLAAGAGPPQDVVVATPLLVFERLVLYAIAIARHIWELPSRLGLPSVAVIGEPFMTRRLTELLRDAASLRVIHATTALRERMPCGDVVVGRAADFVQVGRPLLSHVSLLVLDDPESQRQWALRWLAREGLPAHRWGPSLVYTRTRRHAATAGTADSSASDAAVAAASLEAFAAEPAVLIGADNVFSPSAVLEVLPTMDVVSRVVFYAQKYPNLRVLVFAYDPFGMAASLKESSLAGRLQGDTWALDHIEIMPSQEAQAVRSVFDVVIHANCPPSIVEYRRRLATCRQLSVALLSKEVRSGSLSKGWRALLLHLSQIASASDHKFFLDLYKQSRLKFRERRQLLLKFRERRREKKLWHRLRQGAPSPQEPREDPQWTEFASKFERDVQGDYKVGQSGQLVWSAGEEDEDMELAFENDL